MTDRDEPTDWADTTSKLLLSRVPEAQRAEIASWLAVYQRDVRVATLTEAADFLRDAHFHEGMSVQEIGTALRLMAIALREEQQQ